MSAGGFRDIVTDGIIFQIDAANNLCGNVTNAKNIVNPTEIGSFNNGASVVDNAYSFDGVNDYIDCGVINQVQTFSYSMWVTPLNWGATRVAIQQGQSSNYGVSFWFMSDGTLRCLGSNGTNDSYFGNVVVNADTYLPSGDWGHIVFTHEQTGPGATQKIYINGILRNTYVSTTNPYIVNYLGNPLYIGKRNNNSAFFLGNIGTFKNYNKALTQAETTQNYEATKYRFI